VTKPLDGITVLDLTRVLAGPYCAMMLGDFGADVIKVEQPQRGDDTRQWAPPSAGGESAYYLSANRNKRSITLNLGHPAGRDLLLRLAQQADVLIENFKQGGVEQLGAGYDKLSRVNPGLVYCSIKGYGHGSPYQDLPGYDFVIQAQSGIMSITGVPAGEPVKVGVAAVDVATGMYACSAILAALRERDRSGAGQYVELSLLDSALAWLVNVASSYLVSGQEPRRYGNAHASIVPYQSFRVSDGYIALSVGNDLQFRALAEIAGAPQLANDGRFLTNPLRVNNREALIELLEPIFASRTTAQWLTALAAAGIPAGPINSVPQILNDPHVAARQTVLEVPHPTAGSIRMVAPPYRLSRTPATIDRHPPLLGEHTDEVLSQKLGLGETEIARLRRDGAI